MTKIIIALSFAALSVSGCKEPKKERQTIRAADECRAAGGDSIRLGTGKYYAGIYICVSPDGRVLTTTK